MYNRFLRGRPLRLFLVPLVLCVCRPGCAADYGPVRVELRGETKIWTESGPVYETTEDAKFLTERYGSWFSYVLTGLPPGPARLKIGCCEFKYTRSGERVFTILANQEPVFPDFDILTWGEPREAVVKTVDLRIPRDGRLELEFVGQVENAKFCWFRLYTDKWVVEIKASDGPKIELGSAAKDAPYMTGMHETCIAKFGSRLCINPRPQKGMCRQSPLGHADYNTAYFETNHALYDDPATAVYYGVKVRRPDATHTVAGRNSRAPTEPQTRAAGRVRTGQDMWYALPFCGRVPAFPQVSQQQTLTSLTYTCRAPGLPVQVTYSFHAPFYPQDLRLSLAPYILLDVTVRNLTARPQEGTIFIGQSLRPTDAARVVTQDGLIASLVEMRVWGKQAQQAWMADEKSAEGVTAHAGTLAIPAAQKVTSAPENDADGRQQLAVLWDDTAAGMTWDFTLAPRAQDVRTFVCVGWTADDILDVKGKPYHFKYRDLFAGPFAVARSAFDQRAATDRKVALFESTVYDATVPQALKDFLAFAFQSWMQNTFYCADSEGNDWFSVWEGCCKFHSTVDVEYNVAPLYFEYWPELMRMTLRQWSSYIRNGVLSHDMGMGLVASGMKYPHDMEVEENTNFVLLLYQYWRQTGDGDTVRELFPHVETLLQHVTRCDTDNDGFHEQGTYNTVDQGSAAVQYAKDQVYLAVKALCAYECGARMAELVRDEAGRAAEWRSRAELIAQTLSTEAWLGDHYAVTLNQPPKQAGLAATSPGWREPTPEMMQPPMGMSGIPGISSGPYGPGAEYWTGPRGAMGYQTPGAYAAETYKPVEGWDGYSIYATNGLLYLLRTGTAAPGINLTEMRLDLRNATLATLKRFGSPHTDRENNMWVSQNIWRDMVAAYLGLDMADNVERYWALQKLINREKRGCFTDVWVYGSDSISLDYYPRGVAAFGLIAAMAGLQVDRVAGKVSVAPVRTPLRIPLLAYADWNAGHVPWLDMENEGEQVRVAVNGDVPVEVAVRPVGEPW